jgi:hypothetical protein
MHWHRRFHEDVANVWLRGVIAAEFGAGRGAAAQQNR